MDTHENTRELTLLEEIESDPDVNQSTLATQLGVAVGTVNWHLKRLVEKGYVKVSGAPSARNCVTSSRPKALPCAPAWPSITWRPPFPCIAKPVSV